jgi:hypothetical protein
MGFDYDFYISFAAADNAPEGKNGKGWVTNFQKFTEILIAQLMGQKPRFLFIPTGEKPTEDQLARCASVIGVLSPEYIQHSPSLEDLDTYYDLTVKSGLEFRNRFFKVVKYPVTVAEEPIRVQGLLSYPLYEENSRTGEVEVVKDFLSAESQKEYWMKLADLAYDLFEVVKANRPGSSAFPTLDHKKYVYLAETSADAQVSRAIIKREIMRLGYHILPEEPLPGSAKEAEVMIKRKMSASHLIVHIIGSGPGRLLRDSDQGMVVFQNTVGGTYAESVPSTGMDANDLKRVIWIPDGVQPIDSKFKKYLEALRKDPEQSIGAEVMELPLEDFKMNLRERLARMEHQAEGLSKRKQTMQEKHTKSVYLIFDKVDEEKANLLGESLTKAGLEVLKPNFEAGFTQMRSDHITYLCEADAFFIFKDKINDRWIQMKALDTLKAPGLGRTKGPALRCLLHTDHVSLSSSEVRSLDLPVVALSDSQVLTPLEPLLNRLKN